MSKIHHSELKDLQKVYARIARTGKGTRPSGAPLTGVDITYMACFRTGSTYPEHKRLADLRAAGIPV
jgi:hypothetical protein